MSDYGFRVPVSGQKIPHGWFAALVRFMNSLILRGDGRYTMVSRNEHGTSVTLTPAAVEALTRAAGGAPGAGAAQSIFCEVTGSTAFLSLSGSTASVPVTGSGSARITGSTAGGFTIDVPGGTSSGSAYPVWGELVTSTINPDWTGETASVTGATMTPEILPYSGYLEIRLMNGVNISETQPSVEQSCQVFLDGKSVFICGRTILVQAEYSGDPVPVIQDHWERSQVVPVSAGSTVTAYLQDTGSGASPALTFVLHADTSQ